MGVDADMCSLVHSCATCQENLQGAVLGIKAAFENNMPACASSHKAGELGK
jgi:hypothetical protein